MDFGAMLEGFRFGAPGSPSPLKRAKVAPTEEARVAKTNDQDEDSWHVSESVEADDADADDADAVTSAGEANGEPRGRLGETNETDASGRDGRGVGEAHARVVASVREEASSSWSFVKKKTDSVSLTYGDAVDADAECVTRGDQGVFSRARSAFRLKTHSSLETHGGDESAKRAFFLPRGHPGRRNPPPEHWRFHLDALHRDRETNRLTSSVDAFHAFLLSLRHRKEPHFQALVACLLSVQCRDAVALVAAEKLRDALGGDITVAAADAASAEDIAEAIKTLNFKNAKARYVKQCAAMVLTKFGGKVPHALHDLERLPGVGPKLARLVASVAFGNDRAGVVVDTHVRRVAGRLGWTDAVEKRSAEKTRVKLETFLPRDEWEAATLALIGFGQRTCAPANPRCHECPVAATCPSREARFSPSANRAQTDVEDL
jgi:endonuclease-3